MSQFVNFNKRGFTLPPGCKNLIDLLVPRHKRGKATSESFTPLTMHRKHFPAGDLAQLERFAGMMLHSHGEAFVMEITAQALQWPVVLCRSNAERVTAILLTTCEVPQEEAIRAFFAGRAAEPMRESTDEGIRTLVYPLPLEIAPITALLAHLLQEVYALGDDTGLELSYHEIEKAG
jgi:hypothetical protein